MLRRTTALGCALAIALCGLALAAGPASATVLCEVEIEACPLETTLAAGSFSAGLAPETTAQFETGLGTFECRGSTLKFKTLEEEAEPLQASVNEQAFSECSFGESACTVTTANLPYDMEITYTEGGDAAVSIGGGEKGEPVAKATCGKFLSCEFEGTEELVLEDGEPGEIVAEEEELPVKGGLLCPKVASFSAVYAIASPEAPVFAAALDGGAAKLCTELAPEVMGRLECPNGKEYAGEVRGKKEPGTDARFTNMFNTAEKVTCGEVEFDGEFSASGAPAGAKAGVHTLKYSSGGGACTSTLDGGTPAVTVTMVNLAYSRSTIGYKGTESPQGGLGITGSAPNMPTMLRLQYSGKTCNYGRGSFDGIIGNPPLSTLVIKGTWRWLNGAECPLKIEQESTVSFMRPNPTPGQPDLPVWIAGG